MQQSPKRVFFTKDMNQKLSPLELARQTLIKLSKDHTPATPENYRRVYDEIAGVKAIDSADLLHSTLEDVLIEAGPAQSDIAKKITKLIEKQDAVRLKEALRAIIAKENQTDETDWGALLRYLFKQLDTNHSGLSASRKKDSLARVIINFSHDPKQLGKKIQALVASWGDGLAGIEHAASNAADKSNSNSNGASTGNGEGLFLADSWRDMLIKTIELVVAPQFAEIPSAKSRIDTLIKNAHAANTPEQIRKVNSTLKSTLLRAEMQNDAQRRMQDALVEILRLLVSSMSELTIEDAWISGQLKIIQDIISMPLNIDTVFSAESSLKELIFKQSNIKPGLLAAKSTLRNMVSMFVSRLADITASTGSYQLKIETYQQKINASSDINELNEILESLVSDISAMNDEAKQNHDALEETQKKVAEAEKQINDLTIKLDYISEVAHEDFLTGALNRRGMDEAIAREFERADRHGTPLSFAMLDIDHFKKINDTMGHSTGDKALAHLAKVVKTILRSTDVLARYGGEEFVILLPGSTQDDAISVIANLQRELTKNFFLHNSERVLITFSAGVAERQPGEDIDSILPRADAALYEAKKSGRNRVIGARDTSDEQ